MEARDYLRDIRSHKLTQAQISKRTGIPQPTISKIERGEIDDVMSRSYRALQTLHGEILALRDGSVVASGHVDGYVNFDS